MNNVRRKENRYPQHLNSTEAYPGPNDKNRQKPTPNDERYNNMSMINLGVTMAEAEKETEKKEFPLISESDYVFRIDGSQEGTYPQGRPNLKFRCAIAATPDNPSESHNRIIFHTVPLPWINTSGTHDRSGLGLLVSLVKGCGIEWDENDLDTDVLTGCTFKAKLIQKPRQRKDPTTGAMTAVLNDDGTPKVDNEIKRIYY